MGTNKPDWRSAAQRIRKISTPIVNRLRSISEVQWAWIGLVLVVILGTATITFSSVKQFQPLFGGTATLEGWGVLALVLNKRLQIKQWQWAAGGAVISTAIFGFVVCYGPEKLLAPLGNTALWIFAWAIVPAVPVAARLATTWLGRMLKARALDIKIAATTPGSKKQNDLIATRDRQLKDLPGLQKRSAIILAAGVTFSSMWAYLVQDFYAMVYTAFFVLGVVTNINFFMLRTPAGLTASYYHKAQRWGLPVLLLIPLAGFGIIVDIYMWFTGKHYASGVLGWLFNYIPELVVRSAVPPCFDFLTMALIGYVLAGRASYHGWMRARMMAKLIVVEAPVLVGSIFGGGLAAGAVANWYRADHKDLLPLLIMNFLAVAVMNRWPSYGTGGVGGALVTGGMELLQDRPKGKMNLRYWKSTRR